MISYSLPFPSLGWYYKALKDTHTEIAITLYDNYTKLSYRNRYYLCGVQGKMIMTIPVKGGRNQHTPMQNVLIDNTENWQKKHLKTIETLYRRSPFYEYIIPTLLPLYENKYEKLHQWNFDGLTAINKLLQLPINIIEYTNPNDIKIAQHTDISRLLQPNNMPDDFTPITYYQLFADKNGFQKHCSVLDYIFCEGLRLNLG